MSQGKRKRTEDESDRPSKKKSVKHAVESVKFSHVEEVGGCAPVIARTPGLEIESDAPWKAYTKPKASRQRGSHFTDELLLHTSTHPKLDYTAREETSGGAESLLKHYLGVYDPRTGELQVVPARELVVRSTLRSNIPLESEDVGEDAPPKTALASRTILGEAFGTKKAQKAIRSLTENAIASPTRNSKEASGSVAMSATATAVISSMPTSNLASNREELQAAMDKAKPRPKANLSAETPADVYKVEDLVGLDVLRVLDIQPWEEAVKNKRNIPLTSRFVAKRLVKVVQSKDLKRMKTLKYLLLLLQWQKCLKTGSRGTRKLPQKDTVQKAVPDADANVLDSIRKRFAPDIELDKWAVDNLMTHICALALVVDRCETDSFDLREDLGIESKVGIQYYKELGCKIVAPTEKEREKMKLSKAEAATHKIAKLKLPLEFPKVKVPQRKKR